jgi:hypothetical protein
MVTMSSNAMYVTACRIKDKCLYILSTRFAPKYFMLSGRAEWKIQDGEILWSNTKPSRLMSWQKYDFRRHV